MSFIGLRIMMYYIKYKIGKYTLLLLGSRILRSVRHLPDKREGKALPVHAMDACEGLKIYFHSFLKSVLNWGVSDLPPPQRKRSRHPNVTTLIIGRFGEE
jgi:hypothetical protein